MDVAVDAADSERDGGTRVESRVVLLFEVLLLLKWLDVPFTCPLF
jgi:hypothetical protein